MPEGMSDLDVLEALDKVAEMEESGQQQPDSGSSEADTAALLDKAEKMEEQPAAAAPEAAPAPVAEPAKAQEEKPAAEDTAKSLVDFAKAKGIADDKIIKLLDVIEKGGDLNGFVKGISENIDEIPEKDLLRRMVDEKYAMLDENERNELYEAELEKYKQDDPELYDEVSVKRGLIRMKADLHGYKQELKTRQMETAFTAAQQRNADIPEAETIKQYVDALKGSEAYKGLASNNTIQVGKDADAFKLDVDTNRAIAYLTDMDVYEKTHMGNDGNPDYGKQLRIAAYATDPEGFEQKLIAHGRKLATLELAKDLGNEQLPGAGAASVAADPELADLKALAREVLHSY